MTLKTAEMEGLDPNPGPGFAQCRGCLRYKSLIHFQHKRSPGKRVQNCAECRGFEVVEE